MLHKNISKYEYVVNKGISSEENLIDTNKFKSNLELDCNNIILQVSDYDFENVKQALMEYGQLGLVSEKVARIDCGAGNETTYFILNFIISSMASGITWDIIKSGIEVKFPNVRIKEIVNCKTDAYMINNLLRNRVAESINVKSDELSIIDIDKDLLGNTIYVTFKYGRSKIYTLCDMEYNLIKQSTNKPINLSI